MLPRHIAIVARQLVDVFIFGGDSNTAGARNSATDIPAGYYPFDPNAFIWDAIGYAGRANSIAPLVPGPMEQQPGGAAYVDAAYTNTIGPCGEFLKHWRINNPGKPVLFFMFHRGGGRFSDLNSTFGRAANYTPTLTDGAYNEMLVNWRLCVAKMAAKGWTPRIRGMVFSMGGNASGTVAEVNSLDTDILNLLDYLRRDIIGDAKFVLAQCGVDQTAFADLSSIQAKQLSVITTINDIRKAELLNCNGCRVVTSPPGDVHWDAASLAWIGEQADYILEDIWSPYREWAYNGGNPISHVWRPGDLRNIRDGSDNLQTAMDMAGAGLALSQTDTTARAATATTTLNNGLITRHGVGDGSNDISFNSTTAAISNIGSSFAIFAAAKAPATATKSLFAEGGSGVNPFCSFMTSSADGTGKLRLWTRENTGATILDIDLGVVAWNNVMNAIDVLNNAGTLIGRVNGTAGSGQAFSPATTTLNRTSLYGINYNGGATSALQMAATCSEIWIPTNYPDATYLANSVAYRQRRWGTV